jgi:hypothetical protein
MYSHGLGISDIILVINHRMVIMKRIMCRINCVPGNKVGHVVDVSERVTSVTLQGHCTVTSLLRQQTPAYVDLVIY